MRKSTRAVQPQEIGRAPYEDEHSVTPYTKAVRRISERIARFRSASAIVKVLSESLYASIKDGCRKPKNGVEFDRRSPIESAVTNMT